jgi:hypothetical protein
MRRIYKCLIVIGLLSVATLAIVFFRLPDKNSYVDRVNSMEGSTLASFRSHADSIDELIDLSELIIEGKAVDYKPIIIDNIVYTKETVEVKKALKGNVAEGDKVIVVFTGGELNGVTTHPIKDCPLMDMRGNYMLFLKTNDNENYFIVGGNQGFGLIKDNKIQATEQGSLGDTFRRYHADELERIIKNNISK